MLAILLITSAAARSTRGEAEEAVPKKLLAGLTLAAALGGAAGQAPGGATDDAVADYTPGSRYAAQDAPSTGMSVSMEDPAVDGAVDARSFMRTVLDAARNTVEAEEEDHQTEEEKEKAQEAKVNRVREAIVRIYKKKNPAKLEELPRIFSSYEGRERELYEKLCYKYDVPMEAPGEEKTHGPFGHFGDWAGGFASAAFPAAGAMQLFHMLRGYAQKRYVERQKEKKRKQKAAERARVKQEILDDDSLSDEEKKVKIDALYAKPKAQKMSGPLF